MSINYLRRIGMKARHFETFLLTAIFLTVLSAAVLGLKDPSMVYCTSLGYNFSINSTLQGDFGMCKLPNGSLVDSWKFLFGEVAQNYSYCEINGYGIKTVNDSNTCQIFATDNCAVCVLGNGTEVEVTKLMGLSFREGRCGDGICSVGENYTNCPQDCPPPSTTTTTIQPTPPQPPSNTLTYLIIIIVVAAAVVGYVFLGKRQKKSRAKPVDTWGKLQNKWH